MYPYREKRPLRRAAVSLGGVMFAFVLLAFVSACMRGAA